MNLRKITACLLAACALAASAGCSSGGMEGIHNPVPSKAQTAQSEVSSQGSVTVDYAAIARGWLETEQVWSHTADMPSSGIAGIYSTGYYIFDIDLDGEKELLVQLGGDQTQSCKTLIYKMADGKPSQVTIDGNMSLSVQNLTLWTDKESKPFYINESTLKNDKDVFITTWSRLSFTDGTLKEEPLFHLHMTYDLLTGNMDTMQYYAADGKTAITDEQYAEQNIAYLEGCTEQLIEPTLIKSTVWQYYTHNQKLNAIVDGLKE